MRLLQELKRSFGEEEEKTSFIPIALPRMALHSGGEGAPNGGNNTFFLALKQS